MVVHIQQRIPRFSCFYPRSFNMNGPRTTKILLPRTPSSGFSMYVRDYGYNAKMGIRCLRIAVHAILFCLRTSAAKQTTLRYCLGQITNSSNGYNTSCRTHPCSRTSQSPEHVLPQMSPCGCCMALIDPKPLFSKWLP